MNQDGLSLITEAPHPPPHHWAPKDVNVFTYEKTYYPLFFLVVHTCMSPV